MTKTTMTEAILAAKAVRGLTWTSIAQAAGLSEVFTTSACLGENALDAAEAAKVADHLGLGPEIAAALTEFADKGEAAPTIPKEPLQYRFQEIIYVYGSTIKALVEEKFGPGIMKSDATVALHLALNAILIAGAIHAWLHPSRGIQDRIAGTWIVPR